MKNRISPLTLGTVQLGLSYGVANQQGKPSIDTAFEVLEQAMALGVTTFDTSRHYGDSEDIIGAFLSNTNSEALLVSKFKWSAAALNNMELAISEALNHVRISLKKLKVEKLPIVLYHTDSFQPTDDVLKMLPSVFKVLKDKGLIEMGGISLYYPEDIRKLIDEPEIEAIQIPVNVFDHRLIASDCYRDLIQTDKIIFARSIFLQGLFFLEQHQVPKSIPTAYNYISILKQMAAKTGMSLAEFAFSFVRDIEGINSLVFGADNIVHVKQNVELLYTVSIPEDIKEEALDRFKNLPTKIITPGVWYS